MRLVAGLMLIAAGGCVGASAPGARFTPTGHEDADLLRLGRQCVPDGEALGPAHRGSGDESAPAERFTFDAGADGRCLRVIAVGGAGVVDLDVAIIDDGGKPMVRDDRTGHAVVVPTNAALCLPHPETLTLEVRVAKGRGSYALAVVALDEHAMATACREW